MLISGISSAVESPFAVMFGWNSSHKKIIQQNNSFESAIPPRKNELDRAVVLEKRQLSFEEIRCKVCESQKKLCLSLFNCLKIAAKFRFRWVGHFVKHHFFHDYIIFFWTFSSRVSNFDWTGAMLPQKPGDGKNPKKGKDKAPKKEKDKESGDEEKGKKVC